MSQQLLELFLKHIKTILFHEFSLCMLCIFYTIPVGSITGLCVIFYDTTKYILNISSKSKPVKDRAYKFAIYFPIRTN